VASRVESGTSAVYIQLFHEMENRNDLSSSSIFESLNGNSTASAKREKVLDRNVYHFCEAALGGKDCLPARV
jgi:hypothetical protein